MGNYLTSSIKYFRPPDNYFWRWAEDGNVIEWFNGDTICYRDELMNILQQVATEGLPPVGAILLVLSACKEDWVQQKDRLQKLHDIAGATKWDDNKAEYANLHYELQAALELLFWVSTQPQALRTGPARINLLHTVFTGIPDKITAKIAKNIIDTFHSGSVDAFVFKKGLQSPAIYLQADMRCLQQAKFRFNAAEQLGATLRTGIPQAPQAVEIPVPTPGQLLDELEKDSQTNGLAQLARRVIAALTIPMRTYGSSDQLFGGVADITNRGNLDKLLLSELAHDDLSLMARLANNEALYLRREELPSNVQKQRILLTDTTLKMWGIPRVFALSTALACTLNNKIKATIQSFNLAGKTYTPTDLTTKEGVTQSLEQLDADLHCGRALAQFMSKHPIHHEDEVFLITDENNLQNEVLQSIITTLKIPLTFLITVNRDGHLQFYEFIRNRRKLVNQARFDLQELLFSPVKRPAKPATPLQTFTGLPAIMQQARFPLFFPASKLRFTRDLVYETGNKQVICITSDHRLLYWSSKEKGAYELMTFIEPGRYCFGDDSRGKVYIFAYTVLYIRIYTIDLESKEIIIADLPVDSTIAGVVYGNSLFYIKSKQEIYAVAIYNTSRIINPPPQNSDKVYNTITAQLQVKTGLNSIKRFVNNGFTVVNQVQKVYINMDGQLGFDDRHISLRPNSRMLLIDHDRNDPRKNNSKMVAKEKEALPIAGNPQVKFTRFVWEDGSEVIADSRGFLHLRSADTSLPEISIIIIMSKPTACWASDGHVCGEHYFTGTDQTAYKDVDVFYHAYIQRFLDRIQNHGAYNKI